MRTTTANTLSPPRPVSVEAAPAPKREPKAKALRFFREFVRTPTSMGAIAPSGEPLCRAMVDWIEFDTARSIVEYGPGTGVVTDFILSRLRPGSVFFSIERNPKLAAVLRRRHPGLNLVEDSAANINTICRRHGVDGVDAVLSGLPWASFPESLQVEILDATFRAMKPRAQFVTFAYQLGMLTKAGRRFRKLISSRFSEVTPSDIVWRNLPPAFVYRCRK